MPAGALGTGHDGDPPAGVVGQSDVRADDVLVNVVRVGNGALLLADDVDVVRAIVDDGGEVV